MEKILKLIWEFIKAMLDAQVVGRFHAKAVDNLLNMIEISVDAIKATIYDLRERQAGTFASIQDIVELPDRLVDGLKERGQNHVADAI